jgi:hypothetical protein
VAVTAVEKALGKRIAEVRQRHFGPRGRARFARELGVPLRDYERYERGKVPPGDLMIRICERTGEDLQWLLTGSAGRGTVVISARTRHEALLTRLAKALEQHPTIAGPIAALLDLLLAGQSARTPLALPEAAQDNVLLLPVFEPDELPQALPEPAPGPGGGRAGFWLAASPTELGPRVPARVDEPAMQYAPSGTIMAYLCATAGAGGAGRPFVQSPAIAGLVPEMFGVRVADTAMAPMFHRGDVALVAPGAAPRVGRPVICRPTSGPARCRVWLGEHGASVRLGRLSDGGHEEVPADQLCWSLEVLFRLTQAA